jgi:hypothetical protein
MHCALHTTLQLDVVIIKVVQCLSGSVSASSSGNSILLSSSRCSAEPQQHTAQFKPLLMAITLTVSLCCCASYAVSQASELIGGLAGERVRWTDDRYTVILVVHHSIRIYFDVALPYTGIISTTLLHSVLG